MTPPSSAPHVALFDADEDQRHVVTAALRALGCRVDLLVPGPNGMSDIAEQLERQGPFDIVLWDLSPVWHVPCDDLRSLWARGALAHSGLVITTTEAPLVGPMLGALSAQAQILAKPYRFTSLMQAVDAAGAAGARRERVGTSRGRLRGEARAVPDAARPGP